MPQPAALRGPPGHPDRQLVAHAHGLVAARGPGRVQAGGQHPVRHAAVGLTPGRAERVDQVRPVPRLAERAVADAERHALEVVPRLDQPLVDDRGQPELLGDRLGGLLGPLQRGGEQHGHVPPGQEAGRGLGHHPAVRGQVVTRQPPVEDLAGVLHLAVPDQMNDGAVGGRRGCAHGAVSLPGTSRRRGGRVGWPQHVAAPRVPCLARQLSPTIRAGQPGPSGARNLRPGWAGPGAGQHLTGQKPRGLC